MESQCNFIHFIHTKNMTQVKKHGRCHAPKNGEIPLQLVVVKNNAIITMDICYGIDSSTNEECSNLMHPFVDSFSKKKEQPLDLVIYFVKQ